MTWFLAFPSSPKVNRVTAHSIEKLGLSTDSQAQSRLRPGPRMLAGEQGGRRSHRQGSSRKEHGEQRQTFQGWPRGQRVGCVWRRRGTANESR